MKRLVLLFTLIPVSLVAAGIGPETDFTQKLKTNTTAVGWKSDLGISAGGSTNQTTVGTNDLFQGGVLANTMVSTNGGTFGTLNATSTNNIFGTNIAIKGDRQWIGPAGPGSINSAMIIDAGAIYIKNGDDSNYRGLVAGLVSPVLGLNVGTSGQFSVDSAGNLTKAGTMASTSLYATNGGTFGPVATSTTNATLTGKLYADSAVFTNGFQTLGTGTTTLSALDVTNSARFQSGLGISSGQAVNVNSDVYLSRDAAASWQLGLDAASPVNQTLKAADATGAGPTAGAALAVGAGNGVGGGYSGSTYVGNTNGNYLFLYGGKKSLVNAVTNSIFEVTIATNTFCGGTVTYSIFAYGSGYNYQAHSGVASFSAVNQSTTITSTCLESSALEAQVVTGGSTLTDTFSTSNLTGKITINMLPTSSLTLSNMYMMYDVHVRGGQTITPL